MRHILNAPGSINGPCEDGCEHNQCQLEKAAAAQKCADCGKEVGYDTPYTYIDNLPVHSKCLGQVDESLPEQDPEAPTTSKMS